MAIRAVDLDGRGEALRGQIGTGPQGVGQIDRWPRAARGCRRGLEHFGFESWPTVDLLLGPAEPDLDLLALLADLLRELDLDEAAVVVLSHAQQRRVDQHRRRDDRGTERHDPEAARRPPDPRAESSDHCRHHGGRRDDNRRFEPRPEPRRPLAGGAGGRQGRQPRRDEQDAVAQPGSTKPPGGDAEPHHHHEAPEERAVEQQERDRCGHPALIPAPDDEPEQIEDRADVAGPQQSLERQLGDEDGRSEHRLDKDETRQPRTDRVQRPAATPGRDAPALAGV